MNSLINFDIVSPEKFIMPSDIIEEQCAIIKEKSDNMVIAKIFEISDSRIFDGLYQNDFQDESHFIYEFIVTSVFTPNYKFRIFYMRNGIDGYPVEIILDPGIAEDISMSQSGSCDNETVFVELLKSVLNSNKMQRVVKSLYARSMKVNDSLPF